MKKNPLVLLLALALALTGCAAAGTAGNAAGTPVPSAEAATEATAVSPVPAAEPERTEPDARAAVTAETAWEIFDNDDGIRLLNFSAALPRVTIPGHDDAAEKINTVLTEENDLFTEGLEGQEGLSGKEEYLNAARSEYAMRREEGNPDSFAFYELHRSFMVTRGDSRVLSFAFTETTYTGGVHGYAGVYGMNFDLNTGKEIRLSDLAEDSEAFLADCADLLWEVSRDANHIGYVQSYFPDYEETLPQLLQDGNWYFSDRGLTVIANPYAVAPYAAGGIEFTLPYEWLRQQIREEYLPPAADIDGTLSGEILDDTGDALVTVDDGTGGRGACVVFTAEGNVEKVTVSEVEYMDYSGAFMETETILYITSLADGESFAVRTWIPDTMPTLMLRYTGASGEKELLISQSGKDGSLVMMDRQPYTSLPAEISSRVPFAYDLDGDGERETVDLVRSDEEGHWDLTVEGFTVGNVYAADSSAMVLWLSDMDSDGTAEIVFSGDMGSDDYVTQAWRGDTLEPISFTGECRRGADPAQVTQTADGKAVFSPWQLYLDGWSFQLGTYRAVRAYELADGVISPARETDWTYDSNRTDLVVKKDLPVTMDNGSETLLSPGTAIRLLGTDGSTVRFTAGDGVTGTVTLEYRQGEDSGWTINGVSEYEYFETLPYAG